MMKVGIIGVGWLGEELYEKLSHEGYTLMGTVSSEEKVNGLTKKNFQLCAYRLGQDVSLLSAWQELDYIIITIPPSSSKQYKIEMIRLIQFLASNNSEACFIYTSSTSVYGNQERVVDEESFTQPITENAKKILEVENHLLAEHKSRTIILRLAGLVGGNRHPVKYLSGKKDVSKPLASVNLVHREDVVECVSFVVDSRCSRGIYNLCCQEHPTRNEFYSKVAEQKKIPAPSFDMDDKLKDKTVICDTIKSVGYNFSYISPYDFPNED